MNILQNRIDSYQASVVKWPHTEKHYNKTETFAKAGFYFIRRPKNPDSVRCFMCDTELSHWRSGQSPFGRHSLEKPECPWKVLGYPDATNKPLPVMKSDPRTDPRGVAMRTARLLTFTNHSFWPPGKNKLNKKRYPAGSKLADAGFFFSPTPTQAARIKCPYCRITIDEPSINENILQKHQKLSSGCEFFTLNPHMRATRSRRDTIDSTQSCDTFTTAKTHLQDDDNVNVETNKKSTKRTSSLEAKTSSTKDLKHQASQQKRQNTKRQRMVSKVLDDPLHAPEDSLLDSNPIKIIKRKKSSEVHNTAPSTPFKREIVKPASRTTTDPLKANDVWDIEHAFSLPSISRRSNVTFGKSSTRRTLTSAKIANPTINIFPDLKPSLLKKQEDTVPVVISDSNPKSNTIAESVYHKKSVSKVMIDTQKPVTPAKKRSLLSPTSTTTSSAANKHPRLSIAAETILESSRQVAEDVFADTQSEKKKDKGKGRAVEHNISSVPVQKKKLSLSKSKNKRLSIKPLIPDTLKQKNEPSSASQSQRTSARSSTPDPAVEVSRPKKYKVPEGFIANFPSKSLSPVNQIPADQKSIFPDSQKNISRALDESDYTPMLTELLLSPNHIQVSQSPPAFQSPELTYLEQLPEDLPYLPPDRKSESPPLQAKLASGLVASPPRSSILDMKFMGSTPARSTDSRFVSGFELFGGAEPPSPILPLHGTGRKNTLYDTPVVVQSSRTRRIFETNEDLEPRIKSPVSVEESNYSEKNVDIESMKVEDFIKYLIEKDVQRVMDHGEKVIEIIQKESDRLRATLIASVENEK